MANDPDGKDRRPTRISESWWISIVLALFVLAVTWYQFLELQDLETGARSSVRVNVFTRLLYWVGGKWGVLIGTAAMTVPAFAYGIVRFIKVRSGE